MHVVVSAIWYPVAIARYILDALRRVDGLEITTVGIKTGTYIPWHGGMRLPESYVYNPDIEIGKIGTRMVPIRYVENLLPKPPDVWIQVDAAFYLHGKPTHGKNIIIGTDPHVINYDAQRIFADDFYCMQSPYIKNGDKYLPYAYDPVWHRPVEKTEPIYDVAMVGMMYRKRIRFIQMLGVKRFFAECGLAYDDARAVYSSAIVSFNYSSKLDLTARVFELAAMGVPFAANEVPDLKLIFGDTIPTFAGIDDGVKIIRDLLNDESYRAEATRVALDVVQKHTWDARVQQVLMGETYNV